MGLGGGPFFEFDGLPFGNKLIRVHGRGASRDRGTSAINVPKVALAQSYRLLKPQLEGRRVLVIPILPITRQQLPSRIARRDRPQPAASPAQFRENGWRRSAP